MRVRFTFTSKARAPVSHHFWRRSSTALRLVCAGAQLQLAFARPPKVGSVAPLRALADSPKRSRRRASRSSSACCRSLWHSDPPSPEPFCWNMKKSFITLGFHHVEFTLLLDACRAADMQKSLDPPKQ